MSFRQSTDTMNRLLVIFFIFLSQESFAKSTPLTIGCKHFFIVNKKWTLSKKQIGKDLGFNTPKSGVYRCKTYLSKQLVESRKFLYIGEVGDSSYAQIIAPSNKSTYVSHGLDHRNVSEALNTRILPFYINISNFVEKNGAYEIRIFYKNLDRWHNGIRSGQPSLLNLRGLFWRTIISSGRLIGGLTGCLLILGMFLLMLLIFNMSIKVKLRNLLFVFTNILSLLSITGIFRIFLSGDTGLKLNNILHVANFAVFLYLINEFLVCKNRKWERFYKLFYCISALIFLGCELVKAELIDGALSAILLLQIFFPLCFISAGLVCNSIDFNWRTEKRKPHTILFLTLSLLWAWDLINYSVFSSQYPYASQYITCWLYSLTLVYLTNDLQNSRNKFLLQFHNTKAHVFHGLSEGLVYKKSLTIMLKLVSEVFRARNIIMLRYFKGSYISISNLTDDTVLDSVDQSTYFDDAEAIKLRKSFYTLELKSKERTHGLLVLNQLDSEPISQFAIEQSEFIQSELSQFMSLINFKQDVEDKSFLIQNLRSQMHPLQIESEQNFLDNFISNRNIPALAFIKGDLCDSVSLNQIYGNEVIEEVLDEYLAIIYEQVKGDGVIVKRQDGDEISLFISPTNNDTTLIDFYTRCEKIGHLINELDERLKLIVKKNLINRPFELKYYLGCQEVDHFQEYRNISLLTGTEFDLGSRVLSQFANPREIITNEIIYNNSKFKENYLPLRSVRPRGSLKSVSLYSYLGRFKKRA